MKDFHLRFFLERRWPDGQDSALTSDSFNMGEVPEGAGAYVLGSSDGTMFIYPWGTSPVFYIGQSSNLKRRLQEHRLLIEKAEADHEEDYWWPRYQYGASFGTDVAWYSVRGKQNPK